MFRVVFTAFKELGPVDGSCTTPDNDFGPMAGTATAALRAFGPDIGGFVGAGAAVTPQTSLDFDRDTFPKDLSHTQSERLIVSALVPHLATVGISLF